MGVGVAEGVVGLVGLVGMCGRRGGGHGERDAPMTHETRYSESTFLEYAVGFQLARYLHSHIRSSASVRRRAGQVTWAARDFLVEPVVTSSGRRGWRPRRRAAREDAQHATGGGRRVTGPPGQGDRVMLLLLLVVVVVVVVVVAVAVVPPRPSGCAHAHTSTSTGQAAGRRMAARQEV